jgi:hypothetical protein
MVTCHFLGRIRQRPFSDRSCLIERLPGRTGSGEQFIYIKK